MERARTNLELERRGNGPAVVLIHGILGSARGWDAVADRLAHHHTVLLPHLLGYGRSPRTSRIEHLWADAQARALAEALDREGITSAALVGHDFGGPVAAHLIRLRPDLVSRVAFVATNLLRDTPVPFPLSLVQTPLVGAVAARLLFSGTTLRLMLRGSGAHLGDAGQQRATRVIFTHALRELDRRYGPIEGTLGEIAVPALVVWAEHDEFFEREQGERTGRLIPDASLRVYEDTGHFIPEQRPERLASDLAIFLAGEHPAAA